MQTVALRLIKFDAGTQVRAAINEDVVTNYAERMTVGDAFPPIVLFHDGNDYYLGDGFHRALAAKRNGLTELPSEVRAGTKTDALWFALGANKTNGQMLSAADKRHAIEMAIMTWPDRSVTSIADQIGVNQGYASTIRKQLIVNNTVDLPTHVVGTDGKTYKATQPEKPRQHKHFDSIVARLKGGEVPTRIAKDLKVAPGTVTKIGMQLGLCRDSSRAGVAQRRKDIRDMAERGFTTRQIASAVGITEAGLAEIAKKENIDIPANRAVGNTRRHDANRIVDQMAMDAENLTSDVNLIEFGSLDPDRLSGWIESFTQSRQSLSAFIRRLTEEQKKHVEDKQSVHAQAV